MVFISPDKVWFHGFAYHISCWKDFKHTAGHSKHGRYTFTLYVAVRLHGLEKPYVWALFGQAVVPKVNHYIWSYRMCFHLPSPGVVSGFLHLSFMLGNVENTGYSLLLPQKAAAVMQLCVFPCARFQVCHSACLNASRCITHCSHASRKIARVLDQDPFRTRFLVEVVSCKEVPVIDSVAGIIEHKVVLSELSLAPSETALSNIWRRLCYLITASQHKQIVLVFAVMCINYTRSSCIVS